MNFRPFNAMPRYGIGEPPKHSNPVEVIRANGVVHLAVYRENLWREADRVTQTLHTLGNEVAFWRDAE